MVARSGGRGAQGGESGRRSQRDGGGGSAGEGGSNGNGKGWTSGKSGTGKRMTAVISRMLKEHGRKGYVEDMHQDKMRSDRAGEGYYVRGAGQK